MSEGSFADQLHQQLHQDAALTDRPLSQGIDRERQFLPPAMEATRVSASIAEPVVAGVVGAVTPVVLVSDVPGRLAVVPQGAGSGPKPDQLLPGVAAGAVRGLADGFVPPLAPGLPATVAQTGEVLVSSGAGALPKVAVQGAGPVQQAVRGLEAGGTVAVRVDARPVTRTAMVSAVPVLAWQGRDQPGMVASSSGFPAEDVWPKAEQMQALINDVSQRPGAPLIADLGAVAFQPPALGAAMVIDVRGWRGDAALPPPVAAQFAAVMEAAGDGVWRSSATGIPGLHLDLRFDGSDQAVLVVQTDNDVLGQSLRERTAELQEAMAVLGLRVQVDVRHGDARSGSSFSQRGHGFFEPVFSTPFDRDPSRTVAPPAVQRALFGGLSLSVYA